MGTFINKCPLHTYMCAKNKNKLRDFSGHYHVKVGIISHIVDNLQSTGEMKKRGKV